MKIYGIPNCDTVKKARTFLEKKGITFDFIDFKKTPPTTDDIKRWQEAFGELPVNKKGTTYKKFKDEFEALTPAAQVKFLTINPSMIKRPVLEVRGKVLCFGFDAEKYQSLIK